MDDVLAWKSSISAMQTLMNKLLPSLAFYGLHIQPSKCVLLCINGSTATPLILDGKPLYPQKGDDVLFVMNLPVEPEATETRVLEYLIDKARKKYYGILRILEARASLRCRLKLLNTVIFGVFRWVIGALFPSPQLQCMINFFQCNCVRRMMRVGRRKDELWIDYEARSLRVARAMIYKRDEKRWGDKRAEAYWEFLGHRTRGIEREFPSAANKLTWYRGGRVFFHYFLGLFFPIFWFLVLRGSDRRRERKTDRRKVRKKERQTEGK